MGLDISHYAFSGSYGAFNRLRQMVCFVIGGSFPTHYEYDENFIAKKDEKLLPIIRKDLDEQQIYFPDGGLEEDSGLFEFLRHSDCDGEISPDKCTKLADELEVILPKIHKIDNGGGGHIQAQGGYEAVIKKFIAGCREAFKNNEPLEFS